MAKEKQAQLMTIMFWKEQADVAQRAADMLNCGSPRESVTGLHVVLACEVARFEALLDEVAGG